MGKSKTMSQNIKMIDKTDQEIIKLLHKGWQTVKHHNCKKTPHLRGNSQNSAKSTY